MTSMLLVDTSSLTYRAFFALPTTITGTDGNPVNAVRGYLDMVAGVVAETRPDVIHHCWDDAEVPAGRLELYADYKANRKAPPPEIIGQFALLRRLLPALGETITEAPGWEADDAIGTLVAGLAAGDTAEVLTGDRDLIQLVSDPAVTVRYTLSGTKKVRIYDEQTVRDTFGVDASRYVDFAILRGDPSDGLPGVPGIGAKTAVRLIAEHDSLEDLIAAAEQQTPKLAATLAEQADYIAAMQRLVAVQREVDLRHVATETDEDEVRRLVDVHSLTGSVDRWRAARSGG